MYSIVLLSTCIFHQSAVLLLLVTLAQTWRPPTASISTSATTTAVVGRAPTLIGSVLPVFKIQPLELRSGSREALSALQKAVVAMVRSLFGI